MILVGLRIKCFDVEVAEGFETASLRSECLIESVFRTQI